MHAVTPMRKRDGDAYRVTAVYYTVRSFVRAGTPEEELAQGRRRQSERETGLIERQREQGLLR